MHHWIGTAITKYHYKPEEFGCIKSPRRPVFRQVRLPVSSRTTTVGDLGPVKYPFELSIPKAPSNTTTPEGFEFDKTDDAEMPSTPTREDA